MSNIKKGISLVALIITIIVLIILTGTVIITMNQGNIIGKSKEAVFKSDMANFKEELRNNILQSQARFEIGNRSEVNATEFDAQGNGTGIKDWIPSVTEKYRGKIEIEGGELKYIGEDANEIAWAAVIGGGSSTPETPPQDLIATYEAIKIGDYVEYEPDPLPEGVTSVTVEGKTVPKENLKWRVLKNDGTNVTLISDAPTINIIIFSGKADWVNAPTILDNVCDQLYSKEGVGVARSIDVDDVNEITGYNGNDWQYIDENGSTVSVPLNVRTIGELETSVGRTISNTNRQTPETGKLLEVYAPNCYSYGGTAKGLSSSEMTYQLIFKKADNSGYAPPTYWLGSSCVCADFDASDAYFIVRYVYSGNVYPNVVFNSSGGPSSPALGARPLVTLGSNVQVDIEEGRDGTTAEKAWKIK